LFLEKLAPAGGESYSLTALATEDGIDGTGAAEGGLPAAPLGTVPLAMAQEQFSVAYVRAVVSAARCAYASKEVDVHGVDFSVEHQLQEGDHEFGFSTLDAQLKSSGQDIVHEHFVTYTLQRKHYDKLRTTNVTVPRILVVVAVPNDIAEWMEQTEEGMLMRKCAYWTSLAGAEDRDQGTISIRLPRVNVFDVTALCELMRRVREGLLIGQP
jgi:hypothetical protein